LKQITIERPVKVNAEFVALDGDLTLPENAKGIVLFAHGSGSSRHSSKNKFVAKVLNEAGLGTLQIDLLTLKEEEVDNDTHHLRFDINLLAGRLEGASKWLKTQESTKDLKIGLFGASTSGGAALVTAQRIPELISAVVSRGGRPDLAGPALPHVLAPTLLIVGGNDFQGIGMNEEALAQLRCENQLIIVPGATHLFEEPGKIVQLASLAKQWFLKYLGTEQKKLKDINDKIVLENEVPELTIEQERDSARESFWQDKDINNKIVHESGDENELTSDDARDAAFEVINSESEIEEYKP